MLQRLQIIAIGVLIGLWAFPGKRRESPVKFIFSRSVPHRKMCRVLDLLSIVGAQGDMNLICSGVNPGVKRWHTAI